MADKPDIYRFRSGIGGDIHLHGKGKGQGRYREGDRGLAGDVGDDIDPGNLAGPDDMGLGAGGREYHEHYNDGYDRNQLGRSRVLLHVHGRWRT